MTATAYTVVQTPWLILASHLAAFVFGAILAAAVSPRNDWRSRWWLVAGPVGLVCWLVVLYATVRLWGG